MGRIRGVSWLVAGVIAMGSVTAPAALAAKDHRVKATYKKRAAPAKAVVVKRKAAPESDGRLLIQSASAVVADPSSGQVLYAKNPDAVVPIASITKLMTAMVVLDAAQRLDESIAIAPDDVDSLRGSGSRLAVGTSLPREDMLRLALMSSENRAAHALARTYPGGTAAFVEAMNRKAAELGLKDTHFSDPTGLSAQNVSSARDLVTMVASASEYPLVREFSTTGQYRVALNGRAREFRNTNSLVRSPNWEISVSKTGFINEAGKCLVMQAWLAGRPTVIVLLDSWGRLTRIGDANRIKHWIETAGRFDLR
jgi:D-alanyl-D-alanine endopeptidase (penicillin-binding protein 7)